MPKRSPNVNVNPDVLLWLRESSGLAPEDVSKHLDVTADVVLRWERGIESPTLN